MADLDEEICCSAVGYHGGQRHLSKVCLSVAGVADKLGPMCKNLIPSLNREKAKDNEFINIAGAIILRRGISIDHVQSRPICP